MNAEVRQTLDLIGELLPIFPQAGLSSTSSKAAVAFAAYRIGDMVSEDVGPWLSENDIAIDATDAQAGFDSEATAIEAAFRQIVAAAAYYGPTQKGFPMLAEACALLSMALPFSIESRARAQGSAGTVWLAFGRSRQSYPWLAASVDHFRRLTEENSAAYEADVATNLNNLGNVLGNLGDRAAAKAAYEEALVIYRRLAEENSAAYEADVAMTLNNLGNVLGDLGDRAAAKAAYEEALVIYRRLAAENPAAYEANVATILNNLGNVLGDLGDRAAAKAAYEEAFVIRRRLAEENPAAYEADVATILNNLGTVLGSLGDRAAAKAANEEALVIYRRLAAENPAAYEANVAMTLNNLGNVLGNLGDRAAAKAAHEEAIVIYRRLAVKDPAAYEANVAATLNNLGNVLRDLGDRAAAKAAYEEALVHYRTVPGANPLQECNLIRRLVRDTHEPLERIHFYRQAQTSITSAARYVRTHGERMKLGALLNEFCVPLSFALLEESVRGALQAAESARTLALRLSQIDSLESDYREAVNRVVNLRDGVQSTTDPKLLRKINHDLHEATAQLNRLNQARQVNPSIDTVLDQVRPGDLFLTWLVGEHQSVLFAIHRSGTKGTIVEAFPYAIGEEPIWEDGEDGKTRLVQRSWGNLVRPLQRPWTEAKDTRADLIDTLFPPQVQALIDQAKRVHLIPDGDLLELPMWALRKTDGTLLFAGKSPDLPLSLTAWASTRLRNQVRRGTRRLMYGINDYGGSSTDTRPAEVTRSVVCNLAFAVPEIKEIAGIHALTDGERKEDVRADREATLVSLKESWRQARWIHLAVHGYVDLTDVSQTQLILYDDGELKGLTLRDLLTEYVAREELAAPEVVFLSACFSAAGGVIGGEGRMSVAYAFLHAGVRCVVAAQWAANDRHAKKQMCRTHELLREGLTVAEALQRMQEEERAQGVSAEHWAMFVVCGDGEVKITS